ncbi:MAG: hypothetical protein JXR21_02520 [Candidatus Marinimicrobia bacterium]|mgnify:CR=1 FL=1|nr:hypothetical protein [Candidatus Neomarinimicrobiota bacterium]
MAKPAGFGAKIANREKTGRTCPVCGQPISYVKHYESVKGSAGSNKFKQKVVGICGCNKKDYFE